MFDWVVACMNVYRGLPTGIYATSSPEECHFVADNCEANIIVVENEEQLNKILKVSFVLSGVSSIWHLYLCGDFDVSFEMMFVSWYTCFFSLGQRPSFSPEGHCAVQKKAQQEILQPKRFQYLWGNTYIKLQQHLEIISYMLLCSSVCPHLWFLVLVEWL